MVHELKTHPEYFAAIYSGIKNFELRKNDREYKIGDELLLREFVPKGYYEDGCNDDMYTGRILHRRVDYILRGGKFGLEEGYVVLAISKL
jgi:Domain of unknown function (DUF3850)